MNRREERLEKKLHGDCGHGYEGVWKSMLVRAGKQAR